jgi:hypothetical protein
MSDRVLGRTTEETLEGCGSVADAGIPESVIKRESVKGKPKLGVPHRWGKARLHHFAVGLEEVIVILAGGRPE